MFLPVLFLLSCLQLPASAVQGPAGHVPGGHWFTVTAASPSVSTETVARIERDAADGLRELTPLFPGTPKQTFHVFVHARADDLPEALRPLHHAGSPGFALLEANSIHLLAGEMRNRPDGGRSVVVHELVHILLHQFVSPNGNLLPRWLHEGLAQLLAGDNYLGASEEDLVWRAGFRRLLYFSSLERDFPRGSELQLAYAQSHSYVAFLAHELGRERLLEAIRRVDRDCSLDRALGDAAGRNTLALQEEWLDYLVHGSGARWRALLDNCFSLSMILVLPLLALALIRRSSADRRIGERMQLREEQEAEPLPIPDVPEPEPDHEPDGDEPRPDAERREPGGP